MFFKMEKHQTVSRVLHLSNQVLGPLDLRGDRRFPGGGGHLPGDWVGSEVRVNLSKTFGVRWHGDAVMIATLLEYIVKFERQLWGCLIHTVDGHDQVRPVLERTLR